MTTPSIAIIGAGNMGGSLIGGLINNGYPSDQLWVADPNEDKLAYLQKTYKIHASKDNHRAAQAGDVLIFAIKPPAMESAVRALRETIHTRKSLIISIVTGIQIASIQHCLEKPASIVRAMPNTPAMIGCGATALYANANVTTEQRSMAESILRAVGITVWLENEQLLNVVTALSGSGPAYFFHMMESLQKTGEELGLPKEIARVLTLQTALGAARMAMESGAPLAELRRQVTSPGGTTERAIATLEAHDIHLIYKNAIQAAILRSEELATSLGEKQ